jgi:peroxiredoxin
VAAVLIALVGLVGALQWFQAERFRPVRKGTPAPGFSFKSLKGQTVALRDFRGKVVFLNIWATWCEPCREEMPSMEHLYQRFRGRPFEILAVSIDRNPREVGPFRDEFKLSFPILLDPRGRITRLYRATGVPETFLIDARGVIRERFIGARDWTMPKNIQIVAGLLEEAEGAGPAGMLPPR